jgi:hypothetical protein
VSDNVVDTNIAVIANGGANVTASVNCQLECVKTLQRIVANGRVAIDIAGEILAEYQKRLDPRGQPGVGDFFYRHLIDNQGNTAKVRAHDITHKRADALRAAFQNGNLAAFDPDDRVFALCAVVAKATVLTATDSDWVQHEAGLAACGVKLQFVCGREAAGA